MSKKSLAEEIIKELQEKNHNMQTHSDLVRFLKRKGGSIINDVDGIASTFAYKDESHIDIYSASMAAFYNEKEVANWTIPLELRPPEIL